MNAGLTDATAPQSGPRCRFKRQIDVSQVDVSMNGIELQDREFFAAIREGREPNSSVAQVLPCYEVLHQLEQQLNVG